MSPFPAMSTFPGETTSRLSRTAQPLTHGLAGLRKQQLLLQQGMFLISSCANGTRGLFALGDQRILG